ncbi:MAG TPA: type 4a pilus biogenesis protein PilO [Solirubrobacterales bacterium]|nr:type 4a pilus biogenesis protein PilO [Solirubrobacterales bacterium]
MTSTNRVIVAALAVVVLAVAFWMLLLGPKRDEASKLGAQVSEVKASLAQHQAEAAQAEEAREEFAADYEQLVVLGKAVPGDDDTASLLVQVNRIADRAGVSFRTLKLEASEGEAAPAPAAPAPEAPAPEGSAPEAAGTPASLVSPTEVAASTMPLGAAIGPAGLGVMPYTLTFDGQFFQIADFIKGLDSLVKTQNAQVSVDGRLLTINGFSLAPDPGGGFPALEATFSVTTYLTPPEQGVTAGATPEAPAPATATPAATTTGGTP